MGVFRVEKNANYTVISNYHLRDKNLSLRAIGLLSIILSLPDNWDYSQAGLVAICKDGHDSVRNGLKELETYGYLKRERHRDQNGRVGGMIYHIYETPMLGEPKSGIPKQASGKHENPSQDKRSQINKDATITNKRNTDQPINQVEKIGDRANCECVIKNNIGYEYIMFKSNMIDTQFDNGEIAIGEYEEQKLTYDIKTTNRVIAYMLDLITSYSNDPIQIGNDLISREVVKQKLLSVGLPEIKKTIYALNTSIIKNPKKYVISMLYNS